MKYLNMIYLKQTLDFFQRYGLKSVLNKIPEYMQTTRVYQTWRKTHTPSEEDLNAQRVSSKHFAIRPLFSVLVPTYKTNLQQLEQMAESVFSQTYDNWELCIADGSPKPSDVEKYFASSAAKDNRIRFSSVENLGIAGNTNATMKMASGDYIVLLDHDDMLSPDALFELAQAINKDPSIDALYSDEDMVSADGRFFHNPNFKPDFSLDLLRSCNYITHLYAVKRKLALSVGGFSSDCDGSQDYDFTLKTTENGRNVCHIPKVLYHWRVHNNSVAADSNQKSYAYDSAVLALQRHYERCNVEASVTKDPQPGFYITDYKISGTPLVSVLMYHCANSLKTNIQSQCQSAGYPDALQYRLECPASIADCHGEYILVLRHIQRISPNTISLLLSNCMRPEIGIAAPRILTADDKVSESGLIYNKDGDIISPFAGKSPVYPGYHCYAVCQRQVSLVGPDCFMTSMENLHRNWQKDSKLIQNNQSSDISVRMAEFCFRTQKDNQHITVIPRAGVIHQKQFSRRAIREQIDNSDKSYVHEYPVDSYYTPNFSQCHPYCF